MPHIEKEALSNSFQEGKTSLCNSLAIHIANESMQSKSRLQSRNVKVVVLKC